MKTLFYPPRLNRLLVRLLQMIAPYGARWFYQFELVVSSESLDKIKSLQSQSLLLTPNHPTFQDPIVMFLLSAKLGEKFYYLAAYEMFQGLLGWLLPQLGVYSIRRGLADRPSMKATFALLSNPECPLVVFPEGGCSFQNDTVMPFRVGCLQIAFQALNQKVKQGEPLPEKYVVPVSIKYKYTQDMGLAIAKTLKKLEQALNVIPQTNSTPYQRLRLIAKQVMVKIEQDYGLPASETETESLSGEERIRRLRNKILENCEQQLGIKTNPNEMVRERTYKLENVLKTQVEQLESNELNSESNLLTTESAINLELINLELIEKSVKRLLNFDAIYDGYVAENPTPERFLDTLIRLEREVFEIDQPKPKGFRQAIVKIGTPVNLKDFFADYQRDRDCKEQTSRNKTVSQVMLQIQQEVQNNLDLLNQVK
ncbi:MAG: 1-acyl-sn-glycerol-3-phosphate acyltransferase [Xenococcaceae cyanobacterium MO_234.B1]|nr:1-acyl-sn-glycerol-3-phosphate acyltransferase [Xenococcaceae cyanobacterium MO_234.B1]